MAPSREQARAARKFKDELSRRFSGLHPVGGIYLTVSSVTAGAATGGTALVTMTWRGTDVNADAYLSSYTPTEGDRVACLLFGDQLIVLGKAVGQPI